MNSTAHVASLQACSRSNTYFLAIVVWCLTFRAALAQESMVDDLSSQATLATAQILDQQAISSEPFGAGRVSFFLGAYDSDLPPRIQIVDADQRTFYPVTTLRKLPPPPRVEPAPARRPFGRGGLVERLRNAVATARQRTIEPIALDIDFLFVGSKPLSVQIIDQNGSRTVDLTVQAPHPTADPRLHTQRWLDSLIASARRDIEVGDYPPFFHTYFAETMARRLGFPAESIRTKEEPAADDPLAKPLSTLEWLASTERMRDEIFERTLRRSVRVEGEANIPLPPPPNWLTMPVPQTPDDLPIETIAESVPPECFYLRFGRFANYLWFKELTNGKGAGLAQMVTIRGSDSGTNPKIERMLNTKMNLLTKLFGDSIIGDMAIIGHDLYLQDGATLGVLLESKSIGQLQSSMDSERKTTAQQLKDEGVQLDTIEIAGRSVTLLSSRDHSIRSFRAVDGNVLLLTTSRTLVERFFAVRDGEESLAKSHNFHFARLVLPLKNNYELFAYLSPQFLQHLMSPQRNIELRRRYAAKARIVAAEMARSVAIAENIPHDDLQSLMKSGLLPPWIQDTEDGSQLVWNDGKWLDSKRGALGAMLPISDTPVLDCTVEEAQLYQRDAEFCASQWKSTDPVMLGIRRFQSELDPNVDRLAIEAYISPLDIHKFGKWGTFLAQPINTMIAQPQDDVLSIQAHMAGQQVLRNTAPNNVLFMGLKDKLPPMPKEDAGLLEIWRTLRQTAFYIGAWPQPRYLDMLPLGLGGTPPGIDGFSRALIGMWRWQGGGFSVISFDRSIIENAIPVLQPVPANDPAQVRIKLNDLENTELSSWVNDFWYRRSFAAARGNIRLLDGVQQFFHLTPEDALAKASYLLDTTIVSPIGGEYKVESWHTNAVPCWTNSKMESLSHIDSMAINLTSISAPLDYKADWIGWMRGLQAHLTQTPESLVLLATVDLSKLKIANSEADVQLPKLDFDLFSLPSQLFGGKKEAEKPPEKEKRSF